MRVLTLITKVIWCFRNSLHLKGRGRRGGTPPQKKQTNKQKTNKTNCAWTLISRGTRKKHGQLTSTWFRILFVTARHGFTLICAKQSREVQLSLSFSSLFAVWLVGSLLACLTSQLPASAHHWRICSDNCTCYQTDQTTVRAIRLIRQLHVLSDWSDNCTCYQTDQTIVRAIRLIRQLYVLSD